MNTHAEYRRHVRQSLPASEPEAPRADDTSALAHHADPSLAPTGPTTPSGKRIAWVRPSELHSYAGAVIGRGIDLQAELGRRAQRTPQTVSRSARRAAPHITRRGPSASATQEGLRL